MKIDFVISVRDKEKWRIQQVVHCLKSELTEKIFIVDYGSKKPVKNIRNAEVIRFGNPELPWNKSHALNIGIKKCKSEYICTVDCDMIIPEGFFNKIKPYLNGNNLFIYSTNVRRNNSRKGTFKQKWNWSTRWWEKNKRYPIKSDGGFQLFSRKWINQIKGYDENLAYWGGMDNDLHMRALLSHIPVTDLGTPILHQEHDKEKEEHLNLKERRIALEARIFKKEYLTRKEENEIIQNKGWGERNPKITLKFLKTNLEKERLERYNEKIINFIKKKRVKKENLQNELEKLTKGELGITIKWPRKKK